MIMNKGFTAALAGLMATGAIAAPAQPAAKKISRPSKSLNASRPQPMKRDSMTTTSSSTVAAASTTSAMPGLTAGASTSQAPAALRKKTFVDNFRAGIQLEYYGSSIADPFSGYQTDKGAGFSVSENSAAVELDTRLTLGYAVTNNLTVSYNAYFYSHGVNGKGAAGKSFEFMPAKSFLRLGFGKFMQVGRFKWSGDLRFYPGFGEAAAQNPLYIRTGQNFAYSLTPRLTLAASNTFRYYARTETAYAPDQDKDGNTIDYRMTLSPAIEYQIFDSAGVSLSYNMDFARANRTGDWNETARYAGPDAGAFFELGGSIDIMKRVNLNPYIDMYTKVPNIDAMQYGANLNFTIL